MSSIPTAPMERKYGGRQCGPWVVLRAGILAAESAPAAKVACWEGYLAGWDTAEFLVIPTGTIATTTGITFITGRWLDVTTPGAPGGDIDQWVRETATSVTGVIAGRREVALGRDHVNAYIANFAGGNPTGGGSYRVLVRGKRGPPVN